MAELPQLMIIDSKKTNKELVLGRDPDLEFRLNEVTRVEPVIRYNSFEYKKVEDYLLKYHFFG